MIAARSIAAGLGACRRQPLARPPPRFAAVDDHVAVAANFTEAAKEIAAAFKQKTGDEAVLSFGASGQFYTQITQDAPFEIFLSADDERPKKLVDEGLAVADSRFTYADRQARAVEQKPRPREGRGDAEGQRLRQAVDRQSGRRALWRGGDRGDEGAERLRRAPAQDRQGENIAQAFQFVDTGNAELGFVALSQLAGVDVGLALDRAARPLHADPAGRRAAEERRGERRRRRRSWRS